MHCIAYRIKYKETEEIQLPRNDRLFTYERRNIRQQPLTRRIKV